MKECVPVSAARWQHGSQICNFYLVKNPKIAENSTTTKAREKILRSQHFVSTNVTRDVG
jgi:hypothetical protein